MSETLPVEYPNSPITMRWFPGPFKQRFRETFEKEKEQVLATLEIIEKASLGDATEIKEQLEALDGMVKAEEGNDYSTLKDTIAARDLALKLNVAIADIKAKALGK